MSGMGIWDRDSIGAKKGFSGLGSRQGLGELKYREA